jgi:Zn-dependent protease
MGWEDRHYYRDRDTGGGGPLTWLLSGTIPLFTAFGIRVQAHASLVLTIVLVLIFGLGHGFTWQDRVQSMTVLFLIVLLHEFGHCFAARWVGGEANEIIMHPLGGLALASPPRRALPTFITVAGGPAVNVVICLVCGTFLWLTMGWLPWNPFQFASYGDFENWYNVNRYVFWVYQISLMLLAFNLLPIYPLDGGQMLQAMLWPKMGYYRSMNYSCITGMVAAVLGGMVALASFNVFLALLAMMGFMTCLNMRRQLLAAGPYAFSEMEFGSSYVAEPRHKKLSPKLYKKVRKREAQERLEQEKIDAILAKVSAHGMHSLTWWEKRTLRKATARQRQRDLELSQNRSKF